MSSNKTLGVSDKMCLRVLHIVGLCLELFLHVPTSLRHYSRFKSQDSIRHAQKRFIGGNACKGKGAGIEEAGRVFKLRYKSHTFEIRQGEWVAKCQAVEKS